MSKIRDLTNKKFGRWTVIKIAYIKKRRTYWECVCDCGTIKNVLGTNLTRGMSMSCGCIQREKRTKEKENNYIECSVCGRLFYRKPCLSESKKTCSLKCCNLLKKGKKQSKETIIKRALANTGKKRSIETRRKMSESARGENNSQWKNGRTKLNDSIRSAYKYEDWYVSIYKRDNFTCQECGAHHIVGDRVKLVIHHIKPLALILDENNIKTLNDADNCDELWDINNGIVLCESCHRKIHRGNAHKELSEIHIKDTIYKWNLELCPKKVGHRIR